MPRTTTRQEQAAETQKFVHDERGVTFIDGTMHVGGQPMWPMRVEKWKSSNGLTIYTTIVWHNQATGERRTSCNCPGWTFRKPGKRRECTHTKDLEGIKPCPRKKAGSHEICSVREAVALVPDMEFGKCLRAIDLS